MFPDWQTTRILYEERVREMTQTTIRDDDKLLALLNRTFNMARRFFVRFLIGRKRKPYPTKTQYETTCPCEI